MTSSRKNFIPRNEGFLCDACGVEVPPAKGTFRNHCTQCLASKHVDIVPGDRANSCCGIMDATAVDGTDPDNLVLTHTCRVCKKSQPNRTANDDSKEALFALMETRL